MVHKKLIEKLGEIKFQHIIGMNWYHKTNLSLNIYLCTTYKLVYLHSIFYEQQISNIYLQCVNHFWVFEKNQHMKLKSQKGRFYNIYLKN